MNLVLISLFSIFMNLGFSTKNFTSEVFTWDLITAKKINSGEQKEFLSNGTTNYLDRFEINAITVEPGKTFPEKNFKENTEKLIIVKTGKLDFILNNEKLSIGTGSIVLAGLKDEINILNKTIDPITFFLFQWKSKDGKALNNQTFKAQVLYWENVAFKTTEKGGTRSFLRIPTDLLEEFEMHVTTLNVGVKSHDPHTHPDDEIILVKKGKVEELVNGKPYQMGVGSFVLLNGNEPHGIRNIGDTPCEYYAFRFK